MTNNTKLDELTAGLIDTLGLQGFEADAVRMFATTAHRTGMLDERKRINRELAESAAHPRAWVRALEELPAPGVTVLCIARHDLRPTLGYLGDDGAWRETARGDGWGWDRGAVIDVTHWMSIEHPTTPVRELNTPPELHSWSITPRRHDA